MEMREKLKAKFKTISSEKKIEQSLHRAEI